MKFFLFFLLLNSAFAQDLGSVDAKIRAGDFQGAKAELAGKTDFECLWRLSRIEIFEADKLTDSGAKEAGYGRALELAKKTIHAAPKESHGYLRLATAAGKIALFKGVLEAREYVLLVKENAEKAIALGTGGAETQAWANFVLGKAHLKLTDTPAIIRRPVGLGWGTIELATKYLQKAKELKPDSVLIWAEIAKLAKKKKDKTSFDVALAKAKVLPAMEPTDQEGKATVKSLVWED
jgi:hypothetical protein